ncbi:DNA-entry nuclease [Streptococcus azizii]|uniref:DNA-entry nuclease n=1 Tax=Streptococcus azizii TaxID=1579424 RepID=A0AB36JNN3_9STRE|nr:MULTISPECIES: DNA-entry nuclease [Streptococcus]MBF0776652.1 DNA-entry nuclease [Streptococcus sp. 19428wD3_AN2]ONK25887.1 DNA-entry nuclease [Streptococcus azizii]ONK26273.1 DNA-entry nuclease [Streptococcus azizii]ONK27035.1 DNA-entry nuclease [Streptococcus azizii]TFU82603.1 DNA-entry nuclease [Streptococcus sp. AN2]
MTEKQRVEYPDKQEASYSITDGVAQKLGYQNSQSLVEQYNGFGSFNLKSFVDFNDSFFEENDEVTEFAQNYRDELGRVTGGIALLSKKTISKEGTSEGSNQYPKTIFDTGHILGHMLVGGETFDFNSSKKKKENIFPQTRWSNGGDGKFKSFKMNSDKGNSQVTYERRIWNKINKKGNEELKIYYQVDLVYEGDEEIPRGVHLQAISNKPIDLGKGREFINVFIPNVRYKTYLDIDYSKIDNNKLEFDPRLR